jgi:hypothetical protein
MDHPSSDAFAKGWIPASRDIGIPGEFPADDWVDPSSPCDDIPLPQAGGEQRHDAFTPERQVAFLSLLAQHGNVRAACAAVGLSPQAVYLRKRRDGAFAQGWEAALLLAREAVEQVLAERAMNGVTETIWYRGEVVGQRRRFDNRLLLAHLARLDRRHELAGAGKARPEQLAAAHFDEFLDSLLDEAPEPSEAEERGWQPRTCSRGETIRRAVEAADDAVYALTEADPDMDEDESDRLWDEAIGLARRETAREWDAMMAELIARVDAVIPREPVPLPAQSRPAGRKAALLNSVNFVNFDRSAIPPGPGPLYHRGRNRAESPSRSIARPQESPS